MIKLEREQVEKLFHLADVSIPAKIEYKDISTILVELEKKLSTGNMSENKLNINRAPNILVVDDLELSIHQLSILLSKSGYNIYIARTKEEAIHQLKMNKFDYVLVDLFLPESKNGLELIEFIKKSKNIEPNNAKVIVISGTDDKNLINECFVKGASEFIEKSTEWHKNILKFIKQSENLKENPNQDISIEIIDNKVVVITVRNIHKPSISNQLEKEFISQVNSGYNNILLDLKYVNAIDNSHTVMFITGYKACLENNGKFVICNVAPAIKDAMSYVFLDNLIKIYTDKTTALASFERLIDKFIQK